MSIAAVRGMLRQLACLSLVACNDPSFQERIDELDAMVEIQCGTIQEGDDLPEEVAESVGCLRDALAAGQVGKLTTEYDDFSLDYYGIDRFYTIDGSITLMSLYIPPWEEPTERTESRCAGITTFENGWRISGVNCAQQDHWSKDASKDASTDIRARTARAPRP